MSEPTNVEALSEGAPDGRCDLDLGAGWEIGLGKDIGLLLVGDGDDLSCCRGLGGSDDSDSARSTSKTENRLSGGSGEDGLLIIDSPTVRDSEAGS